MPENSIKRTGFKIELEIVEEECKMCILMEDSPTGLKSSVEVIDFKDKKEEKLFIFEKSKNHGMIYLKFINQTKTYCIYKQKKVEIQEKIVLDKTYIFDESSETRLHIVPVKELPQIINIFNCDKSISTMIKKKPNQMCLLYIHRKGNEIILLNTYVKVSELNKKTKAK